VISPTNRPLPDNTQHSQKTEIHALGGILTRNPSKRVAADPCLRPRGHWDRLSFKLANTNSGYHRQYKKKMCKYPLRRYAKIYCCKTQ